MTQIQKPPKNMDSVVYNYLYQLAERLDLTLGGMRAEIKEADSAVKEMRQISGKGGGSLSELDSLKSLIIKTADVVELKRRIDALVDSVNGLGLKLSQDYVAVSEFGTYLETLNSEISVMPDGVQQYYKFVAELQANVDKVTASFDEYRAETEGYIRTGIVYYEEGLPVYGVAVGQDLQVREVDGETVVEQKNFRATYTASKLSFWQDDREVAYVSNNQLYITSVTALEGITVGKWDISTRRGLAFKWIGG